jgi:hypothetical protein
MHRPSKHEFEESPHGKPGQFLDPCRGVLWRMEPQASLTVSDIVTQHVLTFHHRVILFVWRGEVHMCSSFGIRANSSSTMENAAVSNAFGVLGAVCWSVQLIPQVVLNYRRHSARGLSAPFMMYPQMRA